MLHLHSSFCVCCGFHCNPPSSLIHHICYSSQPLPSSSGALYLDHTLWFHSCLYSRDILDLQRNCFCFNRNTRFLKFDRSHFGTRDLLDDFHICYGDDPSKLSPARLEGCQHQSLKECPPEPSSSSCRCWTARRLLRQRMSPVWSSWRVEDVWSLRCLRLRHCHGFLEWHWSPSEKPTAIDLGDLSCGKTYPDCGLAQNRLTSSSRAMGWKEGQDCSSSWAFLQWEATQHRQWISYTFAFAFMSGFRSARCPVTSWWILHSLGWPHRSRFDFLFDWEFGQMPHFSVSKMLHVAPFPLHLFWNPKERNC